jgi:hypothetical protein
MPRAAAADDALLARTYPRGAAKKLVVETDSGAISLRQTIDGPIAVDVSPAARPGDDCYVAKELKKSTLRLIAHAATEFYVGMSKPCSAGFTVAGRFEEVRLRSSAGDIILDSSAHRIEVRTASGAIHAKTHDPEGRLSMRTGSGPIDGETVAAKLDVATGSGGVGLTGLTGLVTAKTGSGAVSLDWTSVPPSGTIEVRTGSGSLAAAFPKDAKLKADVRSASGRVRSDFDDKDAKLALDFKSGSGDASVTRKP